MIYQRLRDAARENHDSVAVSCSKEQITFRRLLDMADRADAGPAKSEAGESGETFARPTNSIEYILCLRDPASLKANIVLVNFKSKDNKIRPRSEQRPPKMVKARESVVARFAFLPPDKVKTIVPRSSEEPFDNLSGNTRLKKFNPNIESDSVPCYISEKTAPWEQPTGKDGNVVSRGAGINSFGFGGSNACLMVVEYPTPVFFKESSEGDSQLIILYVQSKEQPQSSLKKWKTVP